MQNATGKHDLTLQKNVNITIGSESFFVSGSNYTVDSITISATNLFVTLSPGANLVLESVNRKQINVSPTDGSIAISSDCTVSSSTVTVANPASASASVVATISASASECIVPTIPTVTRRPRKIYATDNTAITETVDTTAVQSSTTIPVTVATSTISATSSSSTISTSTIATSSIVLTPESTVTIKTPTIKPLSEHAFIKDLTLSSKGTEVTELQKALVAGGYLVMPKGVAYGNFGSLTKAALIKYQLAKGITPAAGYFGSKTRAVINASSNSGSYTKDMTLKQLVEMLLQIGAIASDKIEAAKKLVDILQ